MDFGPVAVRIGAVVPRVTCPEHGVATASVPWTKPGSRFTTDFAFSAAWMVKGGLSKKKVAERLRIDWDTVGRLVDLVWHELEPDVRKRFDGLVRIGIDETSYRKGHRLKERLKAVFGLKDPGLDEEYLDKWIRSARHCRIAAFVELRRHRQGIVAIGEREIGIAHPRIEEASTT